MKNKKKNNREILEKDVRTFRNCMNIKSVWPKVCATCKNYMWGSEYSLGKCKLVLDFAKKHLCNVPDSGGCTWSFSDIAQVSEYNICDGYDMRDKRG